MYLSELDMYVALIPWVLCFYIMFHMWIETIKTIY